MPLEEANWKWLGQQVCSVFEGTVLGTPCEGPYNFPLCPLQPLFQFPFHFHSSLAFEETYNLRKVNVLFVK